MSKHERNFRGSSVTFVTLIELGREVGLSRGTLRKLQRKGLIPGPFPGLRKWVLEDVVDAIRERSPSRIATISENPVEKWKRGRVNR